MDYYDEETYMNILKTMSLPGNSVKSHFMEADGSVVVGRLVSFNDVSDHVVVRGHPELNPNMQWTGTIDEYYETWEPNK